MTTILKVAAYRAASALREAGLHPKRTHLNEILAALLGYRTYAALAAEEADDGLPWHLDDAELLVLCKPAAQARGETLGLPSSAAVVDACTDALKSSAAEGVQVFVGVDDYYDSHGREALADAIESSPEVAGAMAETNAGFQDSPELPDETPRTANLWEARDKWSIEADGSLDGEHDFESDRMFFGDKLRCFGRLSYAKAGRAGLILSGGEGYASVDRSAADADHEAEMEYWAEQQRQAQ